MKKIILENKLTFILFLGAHLLAIFFTQGHLHPDEHFQILEFLNFKLNHSPASDLPWEYHQQMRSWFLPFIYYIISKIFISFNIISFFIHTFFFKSISVALGIWATLSSLEHFLPTVPAKFQKSFINLTTLLWFLPFIHSRISTEAISSSILLLGIIFSLKNTPKKQLVGGLMLGLAFIIRFQIVFIIFPFLCFNSRNGKLILRLLMGILSAYVIGFFINWWGYGKPVFVEWNYIYQNIFLNKAQNYGVSPWWSYFIDLHKKIIPPLGIIIIISTLYYWIKFRKELITWITLPFFIIHCLIGHKEWRFLIPLAPFLPIILIKILEILPSKLNRKIIILPILLINIVFLFISVTRSAHPSFQFYQYINAHTYKQIFYRGEENPYFIHQLKVNYYNISTYHASLFENNPNALEKPLFVSSYQDYQFLKEEKKCELLYSENPSSIMSILKDIPFAFIKKQLNRSKHWALFNCPEKI